MASRGLIKGLCDNIANPLMLVILIFATTGCEDTGNMDNNQPVAIDANQVSVQLSWDSSASGSTTAAGYYVYYGTQSGNLSNRIDVGMVNRIDLSGNDFGFNDAGLYYFAIVAYDSSLLLSAPSPEKSISII